MSRTKSTMMLQLGTQAPEFSLPDAHGRLVSRSDYVGKPLLVAFLCNCCPSVAQVGQGLVLVAKDFVPQGLALVAINPNATGADPKEAPEEMVRVAQGAGFNFAYLVDETQRVAKSYRAACTPDFFLFDNSHKLVYRGQFAPDADGATRGGPGPPSESSGSPLRDAVQAVLHKRPPLDLQSPSVGCSIIWRPGTLPPYAQDHAVLSPEG